MDFLIIFIFIFPLLSLWKRGKEFQALALNGKYCIKKIYPHTHINTLIYISINRLVFNFFRDIKWEWGWWRRRVNIFLLDLQCEPLSGNAIRVNIRIYFLRTNPCISFITFLSFNRNISLKKKPEKKKELKMKNRERKRERKRFIGVTNLASIHLKLKVEWLEVK